MPPKPNTPMKRKTSYLWKYFTQSVPTEAKCNLCDSVLRTTNSCIGNLARHLRGIHPDLKVSREPTWVESKDDEDGADKPPASKSGAPRRSFVWRYFDRLPGKRARCALCERTLSVLTVGNLSRHLANRHGDVDIDRGPTRTEEEDDEDKAEDVWRFFEVADEDHSDARCAVCLAELSYRDGVGEMRRHLAESHPDLAVDSEKQKVILRTSSATRELLCEEVSFDEIYVEDNASDAAPRHRKRKKPPKSVGSDSDDDRPIKSKRSESKDTDNEDASIDNFGRYITSLIKKLPRHVACKIQMDFVTQIMQAQMECEKSSVESSRVEGERSVNGEGSKYEDVKES